MGRDFELLDAYVAGDFDAGETPVSVRIGNQVMSWGESVFLRSGVNSINPADIARLRVAGAELRDVLVPVPAVNLKVGVGDSLFLEGFYQFRWVHSEIEPAGTFFSTTDTGGPGGHTIHLGLGRPGRGDDRQGEPDPQCPTQANPGGLCSRVPRAPDRDAGNDGQFGVAVRYFASALNDAELGLYYARIHSRLPLVSYRAGAPASLRLPGGYTGSIRYFRSSPRISTSWERVSTASSDPAVSRSRARLPTAATSRSRSTMRSLSISALLAVGRSRDPGGCLAAAGIPPRTLLMRLAGLGALIRPEPDPCGGSGR